MFTVVFLSEKGTRVVKQFTEYPAACRFYFRCAHSKRVKLVSYNFNPFR